MIDFTTDELDTLRGIAHEHDDLGGEFDDTEIESIMFRLWDFSCATNEKYAQDHGISNELRQKVLQYMKNEKLIR